MHRGDARSALTVSLLSVGWTVVTSATAIAIGVAENSAVLVAFGAVGCVDAIGSVALAYHFSHSLRHDALSDDLERLAHRVVVVGLTVVGLAAIVGGGVRLVTGAHGSSSATGIVLAGASLVVLAVLSSWKRRVARRIGSDALTADAHLSAIGAALAAVTLLGTASAAWFGWEAADAIATVIVGIGALLLAASSWRSVTPQ